jgi:hypothetical protein
MNARHIIAFLLALAILFTAAVHPSSATSAAVVKEEEEETPLTPEEIVEARDVALRFNDRLKMTNDVGSVVDTMFVSDFSERLRHAPRERMPIAFLDRSLLPTASRDELRRYYVAFLNFYLLMYRLFEVTDKLREQAGGKDNTDWGIEHELTPQIINILMSDPVIAQLAKDLKEDEKDESAKEDDGSQPAKSGDSSQAASTATQADVANADDTADSEMQIIKTHKQLESVSATLEKAIVLMRQRLASLPAIAPEPSTGDAQESKHDSTEPYLPTIDGSFYGYYGHPQGTRIIQIDALPFCLALVKTDGRLKILSAAIYVD